VGLAARKEAKFSWAEQQGEGRVLGRIEQQGEAEFWAHWAARRRPAKEGLGPYQAAKEEAELGRTKQPREGRAGPVQNNQERAELGHTIWAECAGPYCTEEVKFWAVRNSL
jgi:hypothetical protein